MFSPRTLRFISYGGVVVGAVLLVLAGVLGWVVVPNIIEDKVKEEIRLVSTSDTWDKWVNLPVPIYLKLYFFNITNYEDYVGSSDLGIEPKFTEVGPFAFRETRIKYDIEDGPDDTLFYRQNITYIFDPEQSAEGLTENTRLTVINIPFVAALTLLDIYPRARMFAPQVLQSLLTAGETIFTPNVSVKEVVFDGVNLKQVYHTIEYVAGILKIPIANEMSNGTFAVYRGRNGTNFEGKLQVYRGIHDSSKFTIIKSLNDSVTRLEPWWLGHCAMVNGTDGTMFPPFIEKTTRLYVYSSEICRSIYLDYDSETEYEGVAGYRFKLPHDLFTDPAYHPPNWCFCMPVKEPLNSSCNFNGIGRLFSCKENVPIAISKPHFLDADPWVIEKVKRLGMNPTEELHDTYLDIEPNTGFPLRIHKRIQIGVEVQPFTSFKMTPFNTLPHTIYPIFWADETAQLDEPLIDEIKHKLVKPLNIVKIGKWSMIGVGAFLIAVCGVYIGFSWNKS